MSYLAITVPETICEQLYVSGKQKEFAVSTCSDNVEISGNGPVYAYNRMKGLWLIRCRAVNE